MTNSSSGRGPVKWRVMIRTSDEVVAAWINELTEEMAESTASLLRVWMPRSIFGAWAEPDWASAQVAPMTPRARQAPARVERVAA